MGDYIFKFSVVLMFHLSVTVEFSYNPFNGINLHIRYGYTQTNVWVTYYFSPAINGFGDIL